MKRKNDNWANFRKDEKLSGHSNLKGNIKKPKIEWSFFIGGNIRDYFTTLNYKNQYDLIYRSGGAIVRKNIYGDTIWISKPYGIDGISFVQDIDGDGLDEICACNGKEIFIFSAENGNLLYRYYFGPPRSSSAVYSMIIPHKFRKNENNYQVIVALWSSREVLVFDFSKGVKYGSLLFAVDVRDGFHPTVLADDVDCDGEDELIVTKRGAIYYIDHKTGKIKKSIDWISGGERRRNYGLFQITDINNDGVPEFVVVSSLVSRHLSVILNDGKGNLSVLWDRFIEHIYPNDTTEVRFTSNSICDIDGDGKPEIAVSLFNVRKDNRWWTEIIDPLTSEIKYEIPDKFLWGVNDINSDGKSELFLSEEHKRVPDDYSNLSVYSCNDKKLKLMKSHKKSRYCGKFINSNPKRAIFRNEFAPEEIFCDSINNFYFIKEEKSENIYLESIGDKRYSLNNRNKKVNSNIGLIYDLDNDGKPEILIENDNGSINICKIEGNVISEFADSNSLPFGIFSATRPPISAIVFENPKNKESYLCFPDHTGNTNLFKYNETKDKPELLFRKPYIGQRGWSANVHTPYCFYDENVPYLLLARNKNGYSSLDVISIDGKVLKEFNFKDFPAPKHTNRLGLYEWQVATLGKSKKYLLCSLYKSNSMNSEQTFCFDFKSGKNIWNIEEVGEGEYGRGFGPYGWFTNTMAGKKRVGYLLAKDTFCSFNIANGKFINSPIVLKDLTEKVLKEKGIFDISDVGLGTNTDPFTAYGSVTPLDINKDNKEELIFSGCFNAFGVLDQDNNVLWWKNAPLSDLCMRYFGIADIDNDDEIELGINFLNGDFKCFSSITGKEKWSIKLGTIASDIVSCDIDGDGFIEFIFGTSDGRLIALGDKGIIKWEMEFDYSIGNPVIADFDSDGFPEIFVTAGNGYIHWIK